jgi:hypothetical protein
MALLKDSIFGSSFTHHPNPVLDEPRCVDHQHNLYFTLKSCWISRNPGTLTKIMFLLAIQQLEARSFCLKFLPYFNFLFQIISNVPRSLCPLINHLCLLLSPTQKYLEGSCCREEKKYKPNLITLLVPRFPLNPHHHPLCQLQPPSIPLHPILTPLNPQWLSSLATMDKCKHSPLTHSSHSNP